MYGIIFELVLIFLFKDVIVVSKEGKFKIIIVNW